MPRSSKQRNRTRTRKDRQAIVRKEQEAAYLAARRNSARRESWRGLRSSSSPDRAVRSAALLAYLDLTE